MSETDADRRPVRTMHRLLSAVLLAAAAALAMPPDRAAAQGYGGTAPFGGGNQADAAHITAARTSSTYSTNEVLDAGHGFFGQVSGSLGGLVERLFSSYGAPNGYILGEEASGAFIGGLRYGEGILYTRTHGQQRIYWQGPSVGWDVGGDGARVMMLVYNLPNPNVIYQRFAGANGSAYLVGGMGFTVLGADEITVVPVRTGVGARLGVNVGYLKFTDRPTWNPF